MAVQKNSRSCGTHDGTFHADEVTACALLILYGQVDRNQIIRTRDQILLSQCEYVCDVGGVYSPKDKLFDHHQVEYQGRLSSAGMILLYLKDQKIITTHEYDLLNHTLISGVDDHDNGLDPQLFGVSTYSNIISNFTPIYYDSSKEEQDAAFFEALNFTLNHLARLRKRYEYAQSCREIVFKAMEKKESYLLFEKAIPWMDSFFNLGGIHHPALFVIMPSGSHWKLRGIPPSPDSKMDVRVPLPYAWAGHLENDLKEISGISGAIFCHKGRFISVWETKEDALKAMHYTVEHHMKGKNG